MQRPIDYTNLGYDSLREAMIALAQETLPEWTDQSQNDLGVVLIDLFAYANDITLYYQTRIAQNLFPATADEPDALVQLLRFIGYELRPPSPATVDLALTFDGAAPLPILVPAGTRFLTPLSSGGDIVFESTEDVEITAAQLGPINARGARPYLQPLPAVQGITTVDDGFFGTGAPNQMITLSKTRVIAGSIQVSVFEIPGVEARWQEVPTLGRSSPADRVFVVQRDAQGGATIIFGDGVNGMIPPRGAAASPVKIKITYRIGGGPTGNLAANTRFTCSLPVVAEATNPIPASGGAEAEDVDRARRFAPRLFRAQDRAVTAQDHADFALQVPGVGKATAVAAGWNEVVLVVAPAGHVADPPELLRQDILAFLEPRRMAGVNLNVVGPTPVDVFLTIKLQVQPYYLQSDAKAAARAAIEAYLSFDSVEFGQAIYLSKIYEVVQDLPQILSLSVVQFGSGAGATGIVTDGVLSLTPLQLPRLASLQIIATGGVLR